MGTTVNSYEEYKNIGKVKQVTTKRTSMGGQEYESSLKPYEKSFWDAETKRYIIQSRTSFIKFYVPADESKPDLFDVLENDPTDIGRMMLIIRYIDSSNMIIYKDKHTRNGAPANKEYLFKMTGLKPDRARKFVKKMADKGIIKEWKCDSVSKYYINPIYTMADRGITLDVYKLFKEEIDPILTPKAIDDLAKILYYENNPEALIELERSERQQQDQESEDLLDKICSKEREQELGLEEVLKEIDTKGPMICCGDPSTNYLLVAGSLKMEDSFGLHSDYKIEIAIDASKMTDKRCTFLIEAIHEYCHGHKNLDKLICETFNLLKKVQKETAMLAGTTVSKEIYA